MQEKVHGTPPQIKIFKEKPPATSWVNENIVEYYQIQSQTAFLRDVLAYIHQLQTEKTQAAKPRAEAPLKESYATLPDKASAAKIADTHVYNLTQSYLKILLETLEKMIEVMKEYAPDHSVELEFLLGQLKVVARAFPALSKENLESFHSLLQRLIKVVENSPNQAKQVFFNAQVKMLHRLMTENHGNIKEFQEELNNLLGRDKMIADMDSLLQELMKALKEPHPKMLPMIENLQTLANNYSQLTPEQQNALIAFFSQLNQFKTGKGRKLTDVAADSLVASKLSEFIKSNPQATVEEIERYLRSFLNQSYLQNSPLPFMKSLGDSVEDLLDRPDFPACAGYCGIPFAEIDQKGVKPNDNFVNAISAVIAPERERVDQMGKATESLRGALTGEKEDNSEKIEGYKTTVENGKSIQKHLGKAALWAVGKSLGAGQSGAADGQTAVDPSGQSLPSQFQDAILNKYMPGQERYLQGLALWLFLDNTGADFGNGLLKLMDGWSQAASTYVFRNFLGQKTDDGQNYKGSYTQAYQQLKDEKLKCSNALNNISALISQTDADIDECNKQIMKYPQPDPRGAKWIEMRGKLSEFRDEYSVVHDQLKNLKGVLDGLKVTQVTDGKGNVVPNEFGVSGDTTNLGTDEAIVINGDPGNAKLGLPQGGLIHMSTEVDTFQRHYADQGQNQQMVLQMRMTEIQQEWTVVSTALQVLNQMYMTTAQGINK